MGRLAKTIVVAGAAFGALVPTAGAAVTFDASSISATSPTSVVAGDFNGDGIRDIAAASQTDNSIRILLGNGNGTFTPVASVNVADAEALTAIAAGDLNGDGKDDLAATRSGATDRLQSYLSNGDGSFTLPAGTDAPVVDDPRDVALGFLNGDSVLDAAVATAGGNTVSIRLGTPAGTFSMTGPEVPTNGGGDATSVVIRDFTGDGVNDLGIAVPNMGAPGAQVANGTGSGTFTPPPAPVVAAGARVVTPVDINHDGLSDIAAGTNDGDVAVARSTGGGAFASPQTVLNSDGQVTAIAAADLDGDTIDDLVATYQGGANANKAIVFIGRGNSSFDAQTPEPVGGAPSDIALGDFNRDSNLDVVTANTASNDLTLLQARGPSVTITGPGDFGNQAPNVESAEKTVTVRNNGAPRLRVGPLGLAGSNPGEFRISSNSCTGANLPIGAACTIGVTFKPTGLGGRTAAVVINSNGAGAPHLAQLAGNGADPTGTLVGTCVNNKDGTAAAETLTGTEQGDNLSGFAGDDILNGLGGNDCLTGGLGNDRLNGGEGRDTLEGNSGNDVEDGGNGNDRLSGGAGRDKVSGGAGNDSMNGVSGNDTLSGGSGNDRLDGSTGNDKLNGGSGKNTYVGGPGNDTITAANGRVESIDCGSGRDSVRADRRDRVKRCERIRRTRR